MTAHIWTIATIGGQVQQATLGALTQLHDLPAGGNGTTYDQVIKDAIAEKCSAVFEGEINFGNPEYLRSFCQENGLTYHISYDGAAEFSAGFYYWHPGMDGDVQGDAIDDGTPTISLDALRERAESGRTIAEVIEEFSTFDAAKVPPLQLTQ